jgi:hypothetical protein
MPVQIINISPDAVENPHHELSFNEKVFSDISNTVVKQSDQKMRYLVTIDGKTEGYVHTWNFAMNLIVLRFNEIIREKSEVVTEFQVKVEESDEKNSRMVAKLYQIIPGYVYNGRNKLQTIEVESIHRLSPTTK